MMTAQWRYNPAAKNGDNYGGSIEAYGLSLYPLLGNGTSRPCKDYPIDLWGHTGEAYGMMTGIFMRPGTRDGFIYMLNGTAISDSSPGGCGPVQRQPGLGRAGHGHGLQEHLCPEKIISLSNKQHAK
jgi:D-alanyl-D-alanine carboxypeptidase